MENAARYVGAAATTSGVMPDSSGTAFVRTSFQGQFENHLSPLQHPTHRPHPIRCRHQSCASEPTQSIRNTRSAPSAGRPQIREGYAGSGSTALTRLGSGCSRWVDYLAHCGAPDWRGMNSHGLVRRSCSAATAGPIGMDHRRETPTSCSLSHSPGRLPSSFQFNRCKPSTRGVNIIRPEPAAHAEWCAGCLCSG
jgi:hypothetical protein